ncbi:hypothetical protein SAMD00019534_017100 [Acytostelium subglobosum LB1]|uniref:hypothetical protein n=1 Tax=Acytostelium subglobosum LB1 TaxID=1410327 RepID=UPI0006448C9E|nr:hypothetical protein SAMD00019534_017100 [Acytostelium subglobosum LB1]GAM18535.1 hypothetical protein SAMD00019534_017100 [Acytostelium subglobosum LB1]|eukprot:XP_012757755.1 hypothetical protein SAMD00019534_017100 [Acytostelium subglobosum LB1]
MIPTTSTWLLKSCNIIYSHLYSYFQNNATDLEMIITKIVDSFATSDLVQVSTESFCSITMKCCRQLVDQFNDILNGCVEYLPFIEADPIDNTLALVFNGLLSIISVMRTPFDMQDAFNLAIKPLIKVVSRTIQTLKPSMSGPASNNKIGKLVSHLKVYNTFISDGILRGRDDLFQCYASPIQTCS